MPAVSKLHHLEKICVALPKCITIKKNFSCHQQKASSEETLPCTNVTASTEGNEMEGSPRNQMTVY
jgi:hypothetical protein